MWQLAWTRPTVRRRQDATTGRPRLTSLSQLRKIRAQDMTAPCDRRPSPLSVGSGRHACGAWSGPCARGFSSSPQPVVRTRSRSALRTPPQLSRTASRAPSSPDAATTWRPQLSSPAAADGRLDGVGRHSECPARLRRLARVASRRVRDQVVGCEASDEAVAEGKLKFRRDDDACLESHEVSTRSYQVLTPSTERASPRRSRRISVDAVHPRSRSRRRVIPAPSPSRRVCHEARRSKSSISVRCRRRPHGHSDVPRRLFRS